MITVRPIKPHGRLAVTLGGVGLAMIGTTTPTQLHITGLYLVRKV